MEPAFCCGGLAVPSKKGTTHRARAQWRCAQAKGTGVNRLMVKSGKSRIPPRFE
jgi:hypothetical protein